jgi:hypothetical protein
MHRWLPFCVLFSGADCCFVLNRLFVRSCNFHGCTHSKHSCRYSSPRAPIVAWHLREPS